MGKLGFYLAHFYLSMITVESYSPIEIHQFPGSFVCTPEIRSEHTDISPVFSGINGM